MNVLSLFDGMSCGQQALERAGIAVDNYFASEIDKYAIQVTMANYPNTKQLGSVVNVNGYDLPKIDLLMGGSPCQSFSFAGKRKGMSTKCETEILTLEHYLELKADGYEFEQQCYFSWEFMRLLNECKPKYVLLENVEMGEKWEKVLSKAIGVNGIHINSSLVSAQNRKRIYWTNIGMIPGGLFGDLVSIIEKPKDKGILLKDVLENEVDEKYFLSDKAVDGIIQHKAEQKEKGFGFGAVIKNDNEKMNSLTVGGKEINDLVKIDRQANINAVEIIANGAKEQVVGRKAQEDGTYIRKYEISNDEKGKTLETNKQKNNVEIKAIMLGRSASWGMPENGDGKSYTLCKEQPHGIKITCLNENQQKKFNPNINSDKANALTLAQGRAGSSDEYMDAVSKIANITSRIRRLTPLECERLQTVKDNYTNHVSDSQRYKMLGNGWTVDVIAHIFKYI